MIRKFSATNSEGIICWTVSLLDVKGMVPSICCWPLSRRMVGFGSVGCMRGNALICLSFICDTEGLGVQGCWRSLPAPRVSGSATLGCSSISATPCPITRSRARQRRHSCWGVWNGYVLGQARLEIVPCLFFVMVLIVMDISFGSVQTSLWCSFASPLRAFLVWKHYRRRMSSIGWNLGWGFIFQTW